MTDYLIAWSTFPDEDGAARAVRVLVDERLIACGTMIPGARSIYRWKEGVEEAREVVVMMKTRKQDWAALISRLHELHPYEVPECIAVRVAGGAPKYLQWMDEVLAAEGETRS